MPKQSRVPINHTTKPLSQIRRFKSGAKSAQTAITCHSRSCPHERQNRFRISPFWAIRSSLPLKHLSLAVLPPFAGRGFVASSANQGRGLFSMGERWNSSSPETSFQIKPDYITKSKAQREENPRFQPQKGFASNTPVASLWYV